MEHGGGAQGSAVARTGGCEVRLKAAAGAAAADGPLGGVSQPLAAKVALWGSDASMLWLPQWELQGVVLVGEAEKEGEGGPEK